jgi:hypothetical protein
MRIRFDEAIDKLSSLVSCLLMNQQSAVSARLVNES